MIISKKILLRLGIIAIILLGGWKFLHFLVQEVPLGYDPGRYRAYFLGYIDVLPHFDFTQLDTWIKRVFPPFTGMLVSLRHTLTGISLDRIVTYGVVLQSALVTFALYFFVSSKNKTIALIVAGLSRISFVQYEVFWWNYIKQLWGMFFLLMALGLFVRKKYRVALPLIVALAVTHRPALLSLVVIAGLRVVSEIASGIWNKEGGIRSKEIMPLVGVGIVGGVVALPIYWEFIQLQIPHLFRVFGNSIDTPTINDAFRSGGTFMTTTDFFRTNWVILGLSILGFIGSFWKSGRRRYQIAYIFGFIWVFGQLAFYQRMMGYADLFFLIFAGFAIREIARRRRWGWIVGVTAFVIHGSIYAYRVHRTWRPIMHHEEFEVVRQLDQLLPTDAVMMNTHSGYSTWIKGWSHRPTISPGLFAEDRRNRADWQQKMREADADEICKHLGETYGDTYQKLYIWQGRNQVQMDLTGPCMSIWRQADDERWTVYMADLR